MFTLISANESEMTAFRRYNLFAAAAVTLLVMLTFFDVIFTSKELVLSRFGQDLYRQFITMREFGFGEMKQGNFPLWNPYSFSGMPFFGNFQSALLYPFNIVFLFLPVAKAINVSFSFHVLLTGLFMFVWAVKKGISSPAAGLSAVVLMFSGPYFLRIYAGHLPNACTLAWTPLILLSIESLAVRARLYWIFIGIAAAAMQILAGHPQLMYYTMIVSFMHAGSLVLIEKKRKKVFLYWGIIYAASLLLTAVQILTGLEAVSESVRSSSVASPDAGKYSLSPESLISLVLPTFFGDDIRLQYWGRFYQWETCLFIGAANFVLAGAGAFFSRLKFKKSYLVLFFLLILLAMGSYTPLFKLFYITLPGFEKFRGAAKFSFFAVVYLALLAGAGFDSLVKLKRSFNRISIFSVFTACVFVISGLKIKQSAMSFDRTGVWSVIIQHVKESDYILFIDTAEERLSDPDFIKQSGLLAAETVMNAAAVFFIFALLTFALRYSKNFACLILLLAVMDIAVFAQKYTLSFNLEKTALAFSPAEYLQGRPPGNDRMLEMHLPPAPVPTGIRKVWGYDPLATKRYTEFIKFSQGTDPDIPGHYQIFTRYNPLYAMLRCRFLVTPAGRNDIDVHETQNVMPHLKLIREYQIIKHRDAIFAAMSDPNFDPNQTVILENRPDPEPYPSVNPGKVKLLSESTDVLTIAAELDAPAILLITDAYSQGWKASSLINGPQSFYRVMPANYALRAVPLAAGNHRIKLEYRPLSFQIGKYVSTASLILFIVWMIYAGLKKRIDSDNILL